jgi:hypothetical protein
MVRQRRFVLPLYYKQVIVWAGLGWVPRQSNRFWVVDMPSVLDSATNSPEVPLVAVASFQPPPAPLSSISFICPPVGIGCKRPEL